MKLNFTNCHIPFYLLILGLLVACSSNQSGNNLSSNQIDIKKESVAENLPSAKIEHDTTSFEYFLRKTNEYGEIPLHLIDSFIGSGLSKDIAIKNALTGDEEFKYYTLKNNYLLTLGYSQFGVCSNTLLLTFNKDKILVDNLELSKICDRDLSSARYSYQDYKVFSDSLIEVAKHTIQAIEYENSLPQSVELSDVETNEIIEYEQYIVKPSGNLYKERTTSGIYSKKTLAKFSKSELRFLRNEIFAKYGYIFKDEELKTYFSKKEWYTPIFDNVSEKLTIFEKYNISLIQEVEDSI